MASRAHNAHAPARALYHAMLSAAAYSFRQKSRLAVSLSWVAGYTNVVLFILCAVVVSHATGNVTHLGQRMAERRWLDAWRSGGWLVVLFFAGAVSSAVMTEGARRRGLASKYILPVAVEAILLCTLGLLIEIYGLDSRSRLTFTGDPRLLYAMSGIASFAMGLQNATITRISGSVVRTTHLTGVVTDFGLEGVQYLWWAWDMTRGRALERAGRVWRVSQRQPSFLRLALLASIFWSFLLGAVLGTIAFVHRPTYALAAPVAFLLWILWHDYRKPIADVRELDLTADPEYRGYGTIRSFLPAELGLYRLIHHRRDAQHHAPDFQAWVERLPRHWRGGVLAGSPLARLYNDAVLKLGGGVQKRPDGRGEPGGCGGPPAPEKGPPRAGVA